MSQLAHLEHIQARINGYLAEQLDRYTSFGSPLIDAMKYAALLGGKRIRPFLLYKTGELFDLPAEKLDASAAALEAIHAYSLAHDDLPAMDNDDLRRGKPTSHIAFNEATAILAGDALQTFAFELIAKDSFLTDAEKVAQVRTLATASGAAGMCLGQSLDLEAEHRAVSLDELKRIHRHKTGALIEASVMMAVNLAGEKGEAARQSLKGYAQAIGLAFQVQDDILDVVGDQAKIGKPVGSDENADKSTYVKLLGLDGAKATLAAEHQLALTHLADLSLLNPLALEQLKQLADFIVKREM